MGERANLALTIKELFDLEHTELKEFLLRFTYPWETLPGLTKMIAAIAQSLEDSDEYYMFEEGVLIHKEAEVAPSARLTAPCVIGAGSEVRHGAFIRGGVIVGEGCVVGNSVELKNAALFDCVQVPHFNYVGDSILGYKAHMGAGAITSNVKADRTPVTVRAGEERIETGLKKCGAFLGDKVEVGCNSVLNPGTVVGRGTHIYPLLSLRGAYPPNCIVKDKDTVIPRK